MIDLEVSILGSSSHFLVTGKTKDRLSILDWMCSFEFLDHLVQWTTSKYTPGGYKYLP